jgi:hypothetical protein
MRRKEIRTASKYRKPNRRGREENEKTEPQRARRITGREEREKAENREARK